MRPSSTGPGVAFAMRRVPVNGFLPASEDVAPGAATGVTAASTVMSASGSVSFQRFGENPPTCSVAWSIG